MAGFVCDIVTPAAKLVSSEAEMVVVPGVEGEMGFLKDHAPLVSVLADGVVRVTPLDGGDVARYALQGGYVEVGGGKVIILADRAVAVSDIDVEKVRGTLSSVEERLSSLSEADAAKTTLPADKAWCEVQLEAANAA